MLGNDQSEALAERLLRGVTKQYSRGAVPPDDFARAVCIDDSICDLVEDTVRTGLPWPLLSLQKLSVCALFISGPA